MPDSKDELLEIIDDIFENGDDLPSRVSNRLLLAGVRKSYRVSMENKQENEKNRKAFEEKHEGVMTILNGDPKRPNEPGALARIDILERFKQVSERILWLLGGSVLSGAVAFAYWFIQRYI